MLEIRQLTNPYFTAHFVGGPLHGEQQEPRYGDLMPDTIKVAKPSAFHGSDDMGFMLDLRAFLDPPVIYVLTERNEKIGIYVEAELLAQIESMRDSNEADYVINLRSRCRFERHRDLIYAQAGHIVTAEHRNLALQDERKGPTK